MRLLHVCRPSQDLADPSLICLGLCDILCRDMNNGQKNKVKVNKEGELWEMFTMYMAG